VTPAFGPHIIAGTVVWSGDRRIPALEVDSDGRREPPLADTTDTEPFHQLFEVTMHKSTRAAVYAAALLATGAIATANAGSAAAETRIRHYSGYGAEYACNADKAAIGSVPNSVVLCDRLNNGVYRLSIVPYAEIPLHLLVLMATGSFDGLS
jgi:hypothetical protein